MKAENLRIPKLSLLLHLGDSKPGLRAIKNDRAFFLRHPVGSFLENQKKELIIEGLDSEYILRVVVSVLPNHRE